jgi:GNAT superfamily N-acetyltransferase
VPLAQMLKFKSLLTDIRIDVVPAKGLYAFAEAFFRNAGGQKIAPISRHRALAHSMNPCADDDDAGLLVAYHGHQCIGYFGLLPGFLETASANRKIYYGSTFYVLPESRNSMVGRRLITRVTSLGRDVVNVGYTQQAARVYSALQFRQCGPLKYLVVIPDRLPKMFGWWKGFFWQRCAGRMPCASHCFTREVKELPKNWRFRPPGTTPRFYRGPDLLNWMLSYPWVRDDVTPAQPAYYFSDTRQYFRHVAAGLFDENRLLGWLIMSVSRNLGRCAIQLVDYFAEAENLALIARAVFRYANHFRADEVFLPIDLRPLAMILPFSRHAVIEKERNYLCFGQEVLPPDLNTMELGFSDGDLAYT